MRLFNCHIFAMLACRAAAFAPLPSKQISHISLRYRCNYATYRPPIGDRLLSSLIIGNRSPCRSFRLFSTADDSKSDTARVVFLGTPDVAATALKKIVEDSKKVGSSYEIVGVVTQPPKRRKRRGKEIASPVGLVAEELGIPTLCPEKARDTEFLNAFENEMRPDLCITAAYGQWLPKRFLAAPTYGTMNIHPSLLPRWRGASPVQRSLEAGDNPVGVTVLFTVAKMDAGPIVSQKECTIEKDDEATTLLPFLFNIGTELLLEAIPDVVAGKITMDTATEQDEEMVVNADMISSSEGELKVWKDSARDCHNKCRGFSMWPGTYMFFQIGDDEDEETFKTGENEEAVRVKVIKTRVLEEKSDPTDVVEIGSKKGDGLRVVCDDGSVLEVLLVQPATRKAMDAKSFVNGLRGKSLRWVKMPEENPEES